MPRPHRAIRQRLVRVCRSCYKDPHVENDLRLRLIVRAAPDNPVARFRYELVSTTERRLTKVAGVDTVLKHHYSA